MNRRSPGAESGPGELFKSASVGRPSGNRHLNRSPDRNIVTGYQNPHSIYSGTLPSSYSGNSIERDFSPNNSGSFHGNFPVQKAMQLPLYSSQQMNIPLYMNHTPTSSLHYERSCLSQPVSRSTSRADSFKSNLTQLQIHTSDNHISPYYHYNKPMYQLHGYNYNTFNGQIQAAQACDPGLTSSQNLDSHYFNYPQYDTDLSGSQNLSQYYQNTEQGYETDLSGSQSQFYHSQESFSGQMVDNQNVVYLSNEIIPEMTPYVSQSNISNISHTETEQTLQEQQVFAPPAMFADFNESKHSENSYTSLEKIPTEPSDNEESQVSRNHFKNTQSLFIFVIKTVCLNIQPCNPAYIFVEVKNTYK